MGGKGIVAGVLLSKPPLPKTKQEEQVFILTGLNLNVSTQVLRRSSVLSSVFQSCGIHNYIRPITIGNISNATASHASRTDDK